MSTTEIAKTADTDIDLRSLITEGKNPRGIPAAVFIDDVEKFLTKGKGHEILLGAFQELYSIYPKLEDDLLIANMEIKKLVNQEKYPKLNEIINKVGIKWSPFNKGIENFKGFNLRISICTLRVLNVRSFFIQIVLLMADDVVTE